MSRTRTITLTLGSLAAGAVLATGVTGLALADDSAGSSSSPSASTDASTEAPRMRDGMRDGRGHGGPGGRGMMGAVRDAVGQPIHGETVVKKEDGTFATVRHLHGTVTAVSSSSITVRAEDGYTATFTVNADTVVRTGLPERGASSTATSTIADVTVGDVAHVSGIVNGSSATADRVFAMTAAQAAELEALREAHQQQHADAATGSTATSSTTQVG